MERIITYIQSLPTERAQRLSWMIPTLVALFLVVIFAVPFFLPDPEVDENGEVISEVVGPIDSIFQSIGAAWSNMGDTVGKIQKE